MIRFAKHIARKAASRNISGCDGGANIAVQPSTPTEKAIVIPARMRLHIGRVAVCVAWGTSVALLFNSFRQAFTVGGMIAITVVSAVSAAIAVFAHSRSMRRSARIQNLRQR